MKKYLERRFLGKNFCVCGICLFARFTQPLSRWRGFCVGMKSFKLVAVFYRVSEVCLLRSCRAWVWYLPKSRKIIKFLGFDVRWMSCLVKFCSMFDGNHINEVVWFTESSLFRALFNNIFHFYSILELLFVPMSARFNELKSQLPSDCNVLKSVKRLAELPSRFISTFHSKLKVKSIQLKDVSQQPFAASLLTQLHHQLEPAPFFGHLSTFLNANNRLEIHEARLFAQRSMHRRFVLQINWIKTEHYSKALLGEIKMSYNFSRAISAHSCTLIVYAR